LGEGEFKLWLNNNEIKFASISLLLFEGDDTYCNHRGFKPYSTLAGFPLGGILRAERNLSLSFLISSTREITRQRKIPLRAQNSA
jgi:hypothetical protein